jgi:hypothetical protein
VAGLREAGEKLGIVGEANTGAPPVDGGEELALHLAGDLPFRFCVALAAGDGEDALGGDAGGGGEEHAGEDR